MKKQLAIMGVYIALFTTNGFAHDHHPGDTVFPGSPEWVHAGSPRNSETGDSIMLMYGADGKLHRLGYEIEDIDGSWIPNTLDNYEMVAAHKELAPLREAVREIAREMPDKIHSFGTPPKRVRPHNKTAYDPYKDVIHWADSIATRYGDPTFRQRVERYYRSPKRLYSYYTPFYIHREKS